MSEYLFHLSRDTGRGLQSELREHMVKAILDGHIRPGRPLPSSRHLAQQLSVARNTVVLAYQQLVDEGYLVSRERSGYFVNEDILAGRVRDRRSKREQTADVPQPDWQARARRHPSDLRFLHKPSDWRKYTYPFVYGQTDPALFPIADWRECCRQALTVRAIHDWARDHIDVDDELLIEELRSRVLPRRGVWAKPEEILITLGAQHALYIIAELFAGGGVTVGMEEPGYMDARNIFALSGADIRPLGVDGNGLQMSRDLDACDYVFVTPSHQFPTTVTLPLNRRKALLRKAAENDFVIIEDDYESETNFIGEPTPALKSLDTANRVLYVGSLSKTLAPGLRLGFLVAPEPVIREARTIRRLMLRHPPSNNQRSVALFLALGHHDSLVRRLRHAYAERWRVMSEALATHMPNSARAPTFGGTAFWVSGPPDLDAEDLAARAAKADIVIEPGETFFHDPPHPCRFFRLGYSSISVDRIEPGIARLASLLRP